MRHAPHWAIALPSWIFSYKEDGVLDIDELLGILTGYVLV
jgi:hypothetical protein